mmetsp:Transcript_58853/g.91576  ORF Transcript_58853/g.91576 Transcript_58853/m.91576 type:complete len:486 (-) Transcript_58853:20-1477(-)
MSSVRPDESTNSFFEALYKDKDAEAHQIMDGLFLGSNRAAQDRKAMQKRGVTHALIVHPGIPEPHPQHFKYGRAPLADVPTANLLEVLPDALDFLRLSLKSGRVFVFCMKGISRSSSVVISFIMLAKGLSFEEAWKLCEQKRPIVYPNIGFQQQLKHLETVLSGIEGSEPMEKRLNYLRSRLPSGDLGVPDSPFRVRDLIGNSMSSAFDEVEMLAGRIFSQPQLLQKREQWKRHGLYFENLHKYKTLPSDIALVSRARAVSEKLSGLPKVFSDSLKGVKLATAVASQIQSWIVFAEPLLEKEEAETKENQAEEDMPSPNSRGLDAFEELMAARREMEKDTKGEVKAPKAKDDKSKKKDKKQKKKDKKKKKKDKKDEKKNKKAVKKAKKDADEIDKLAREAELAALEAGEQAERIAEAAREAEAALAKLESDEALDAADAAADAAAEARANFAKSVGLARSESSSGSDSASGIESDSGNEQKRARK